MSAVAISDPTEVVRRCTRNGYTGWQNVAAILGQSIDSVRSQYDPGYRKGPRNQIVAFAEPEPITLRKRIAAFLERTPASTSFDLAERFGGNPRNMQKMLSVMQKAGVVHRTKSRPAYWALTGTKLPDMRLCGPPRRLKVVADRG